MRCPIIEANTGNKYIRDDTNHDPGVPSRPDLCVREALAVFAMYLDRFRVGDMRAALLALVRSLKLDAPENGVIFLIGVYTEC